MTSLALFCARFFSSRSKNSSTTGFESSSTSSPNTPTQQSKKKNNHNNSSSSSNNNNNNHNNTLFELPVDIFLLIKEYLINRDYRKLLNTSKHSQIVSVKSYSIYYNLPSRETWRYLTNDQGFRDHLQVLLSSSSRQLSLCFGQFPSKLVQRIENIHFLCHLRHLTLQRVKIDETLLQRIEHVQKLHLEGYEEMKVLPKFQNIGEIIIKDFAQLIDVRNIREIKKITLIYCPRLEDISSLEGSEDVTIKSCIKVVDISSLRYAKRVSLYYCHAIVNINSLKNIPNLTVHECDNVRNVKELTDVTSLSLTMKHILTFPKICHAKTLFLDYNGANVQNLNYSTFDELEELTIDKCDSYADFSKCPNYIETNLKKITITNSFFKSLLPLTLTNIYELELFACHDLQDLTPFGHIPILKIGYCYKVTRLDGLGQSPTQKHVILTRLYDLRDLQPLQYIKRVEIVDCSNVERIDTLSYCEEIIIEDCFKVMNLTKALSNHCQSLKIIGCQLFNSLQYLENIPNVEIIDCGIKHFIKRKKYSSLSSSTSSSSEK